MKEESPFGKGDKFCRQEIALAYIFMSELFPLKFCPFPKI